MNIVGNGSLGTLDNYIKIKKKPLKKIKSNEKSCINEMNIRSTINFELCNRSLLEPAKQNNSDQFILLGNNLLTYFLQHNLYSSVKTREIKKMQEFMMKYLNIKEVHKLTEVDNTEIGTSSQSYTEDGEQLIIDKKTIISSINEILTEVIDDFKSNKNPKFLIPLYNVTFINNRWQVENVHQNKTVEFNSKRSQLRFNCMLYLLHHIKCLLEDDLLTTKRECFYLLKPSLNSKNQDFTDKILNDISVMLNVGMWDLNIKAQTGLLYGNLTLIMPKENVGWIYSGNYIPYNALEILQIKTSACFILVVEKETVFNKLIQENIQQYITKPFILITGKGFPDKSTQLFLKKLWIDLKIPVLILVDADPWGIEIMMNYRFGSKTNAHLSDYLAIPKAKWIGIRPSEICKYSNDTICLSENDKKKIQQMMKLDCMNTEPNIQKELKILLEKGIKCEIESLLKVSLISLIDCKQF